MANFVGSVEIELGALEPTDASFRAVSLFLTADRSYAGAPLSTLGGVYASVIYKQTMGAVLDGKLQGITLWRELPERTALSLIEERRMPMEAECVQQGEALVLTAILARSKDVIKAMWKELLANHKGKIILYERHRLGEGRPSSFKWVDKEGVVLGERL